MAKRKSKKWKKICEECIEKCTISFDKIELCKDDPSMVDRRHQCSKIIEIVENKKIIWEKKKKELELRREKLFEEKVPYWETLSKGLNIAR